eukprot:gb/GEZN01006588.1/.p1 GENE.gb/GEZN01006588.1/~~gb/GEZN01006588.1/.p1  ORF type:complete len:409 (-),score=14.06 gb/GEZN01006588.1/:339-1565(-)
MSDSTTELGPPPPKSQAKKDKKSSCCKDWSKHSILKWIFPLLVILIASFIYCVFLLTVLMPEIGELTQPTLTQATITKPAWNPSHVEIIVLLVIFHLVTGMFVYCFFMAMLTSPGYVPETKRWRDGDFDDIHEEDTRRLVELLMSDTLMADLDKVDMRYFIKSFPLIERKFGKKRLNAKNGIRECKYCQMYKPDRSHHCKTCNTCVLRMDHHCPWIANCVGFNNYKYFLLLLVYGVLTLFFVLVAQLPRLIACFRLSKPQQYALAWRRDDVLVVVSYTMAFTLAIFLFIFMSFHFWLTANSLSTIEYKEKVSHGNPEVVARHYIAHVKFDRGAYGNLEHVLGPFWMWLLPITPTYYVQDIRTGRPLRRRGKYLEQAYPGCYYVSPEKRIIWDPLLTRPPGPDLAQTHI